MANPKHFIGKNFHNETVVEVWRPTEPPARTESYVAIKLIRGTNKAVLPLSCLYLATTEHAAARIMLDNKIDVHIEPFAFWMAFNSRSVKVTFHGTDEVIPQHRPERL